MKRIAAFFTPAKRKAIYTTVGVAAAAGVVFGVVTQDQLSTLVQNISGVVVVLTALMAALNVPKSEG